MAEVPLFSTQRIELLAGWLVRWLVDWLVAGSWWLVVEYLDQVTTNCRR